MPVEVGLWNVSDSTAKKVDYSPITTEKRLEDILASDISILGDEYLMIGRQIKTSQGKFIDLLAIDEDGNLSVIELKKNKTPRDVVAQTLDYASWVQNLSYKDIVGLFVDSNKTKFEPAFEEKFGTPPPERINQSHDMVVVCSELDNESERIINYLSDNFNVPVNAVFFRFFKDNHNEYISRSWLIDPTEVEEKSSKSKSQSKAESWNGRDYVVNVDRDLEGVSTWEDAVKYGFLAAGGGKWYVNTLKNLSVGARVFAMLPKVGYLGVGYVEEKAQIVNDFTVLNDDGKQIPILEAELIATAINGYSDSHDSDMREHFVRIKWEKTVDEKHAFWTKGLSANQNSAFKLRNQFTLDKLVKFFGLEE